jgi:hypothetical protein
MVRPESLLDRACHELAEFVRGRARADLVDEAMRDRSLAHALARLRAGMRSHDWSTRHWQVDLGPAVKALDQASRQDGLHVLHDWDGKAAQVTPNSIAVDVVDFVSARRGSDPPDRSTLAIALDYYLLYVLALLATRAWDTGDPAGHMDRVTALVADLQGQNGSGQRFADDAETLLLVATSHFEPDERGYAQLLARARALPPPHRLRMALTHAQAMGSHLRFGYEVTYARDFQAMRDDNGADYPWLVFGLSWLMDEYARMAEAGVTGEARDRIAEAIVNGLTPDPLAILETPPPSLAAHRNEYERFLTLFDRHLSDLVATFEVLRPRDRGYSPIALFYNFSQNALKGIVVDALLRGEPWPFGLNDLLTGVPTDAPQQARKAELARTLMTWARAHPDRIGGRLAPVIVYDHVVGRQTFGAALRAIRARVAR